MRRALLDQHVDDMLGAGRGRARQRALAGDALFSLHAPQNARARRARQGETQGLLLLAFRQGRF